jgi:hypothetical protein
MTFLAVGALLEVAILVSFKSRQLEVSWRTDSPKLTSLSFDESSVLLLSYWLGVRLPPLRD